MSEGHAEGDYVRYVGDNDMFENYTSDVVYMVMLGVEHRGHWCIADDFNEYDLWPPSLALNHFHTLNKEELAIAILQGKVRK